MCGFLKGGQVGFVNTAVKGVNGTQVGFVNSTKKTLKGFQLGFVNYADTILGGIPFGFLSFIKKGGYKAIEMGCTEMYPVNLSLKTGIRKFYASLIASCNPDLDNANKPFYSIYNNELHNRNNLIVGFRLALRYNCF